ncbi:MAG: hypothetical protein HUJ92_06555 [Bacteroidales bacterium]|nr:hypothetical protein [Bacteroidales bacterium]
MKAKLLLATLLTAFLAIGCQKLDNESLWGTWARQYEDERISEDSFITYLIYPEGRCIKEVYHALAIPSEAKVEVVGTWKLSGTKLNMTFPNSYDSYDIAKYTYDKMWAREGFIFRRIENRN